MLRPMARTTIDINDELVAEIRRCYGLGSTEEAVDLALRRLAGPPIAKDLFDELDANWRELTAEEPGEVPTPRIPL